MQHSLIILQNRAADSLSKKLTPECFPPKTCSYSFCESNFCVLLRGIGVQISTMVGIALGRFLMSTNKNPEAPAPDGILRNIREIANTIFRADKWIGITVNIALLIVLVAIFAHSSGILEDGFSYLVARSWVPLAIAAGFLVIAKAAANAIYGHIIISTMMGLMLIFIAQALSGNRIPFISPAYCVFEYKAAKCPFSTTVDAADIARSDVIDTVPASPPPPSPLPEESQATGEPAADPTAYIPGPGRVFVQFAGSIPRESVADMAENLASQGWNMQQPDRGGKRTASAAGLNEVRYFHPEDKVAAEELAKALAVSANWITGNILVKDFSSAKLKAPAGQLEIWTSI